ncbi:MAG TPA: hypothetical protein VL993_09895 [Stellaceae bacterium]|nr:hypothetical protein [Stellaceae bacterium]
MAMRKAIAILLAALCVSCSSARQTAASSDSDRQTEIRREQDCANTAWKAANLGLWYNVCRPNAF